MDFRDGSYIGGCQNDGPFLDPHYNTAPKTYLEGQGDLVSSVLMEITRVSKWVIGRDPPSRVPKKVP